MNCESCEMVRAKLIAAAMKLAGKPLDEIALTLAQKYNANYYLRGQTVYRMSKCPPHHEYEII